MLYLLTDKLKSRFVRNNFIYLNIINVDQRLETFPDLVEFVIFQNDLTNSLC